MVDKEKEKNARCDRAGNEKNEMKKPVFFQPIDPWWTFRRQWREKPVKTITANSGWENETQETIVNGKMEQGAGLIDHQHSAGGDEQIAVNKKTEDRSHEKSKFKNEK